ncbi:restriction endonuclease subunit S [Thermococcus sp.]|uniref:restriction endonuclease subunit S n=1 Tax=Thermococcus sp. TaxID=35749 RepID=UPI00262A05A6|nr:restriction endonuclease subunit S [Thermococcus sp.]
MTRFKKTPIGEIPEDWEVVELGDLLDLKNGKRPIFSEKGSIPVYGANGIMGYTDTPLVKKGKVLIIGRVGASGEVHLAEGPVWISDNAMYSSKIESKLVDIEYLGALLKYINLQKLATKNVHPLITKKILMPFKIPLPPLPEQRKIAEILRTVDEAIEKTDEAIERTERLKKGLMQRLLTRGIKHERFKKTELGEIPEEWQVVRLEEVAERRNETVKPDSIEEVPFVGLEHIEPGRIKLSQWGSSRNVKSLKSKFHCGDILYGKLRPYLDKAVIAEFNGICSTDIIVIRTKSSKTIPEYLIWIIHSKRFIEYAKKTMKGVNHPRTSWNSIKQFQLPLPPLEEQKQIAEILSTVDKKLELLRQRREKLERVKRGLMKDLLTGRRRVKHYGDQKI